MAGFHKGGPRKGPGGGGEFPKKFGGDRPRPYGDRSGGGDRPRPYGDRAGGGDRPRPYGDRSGGGDRPRPYGDRAGGGDRPRPYGDRSGGGDRPRPYGDRSGGGDRPRPYGDRSGGGDRPRPYGDRSGGGDRPRPYGDRSGGGDRPRPYGDRSGGGDRPRPYGDRSGGGDRPRPYGDRSGGGDRPRPYGDRPGGGDRSRPFGGQDSGPPPRRQQRTKIEDAEPFFVDAEEQETPDEQTPVESIASTSESLPESDTSEAAASQEDLQVASENAEGASESPSVVEPQVSVEIKSEEDPPWFKRLLALTTERGREKEGRFLAEGQKCVQEICEHNGDLVDGVYHLQSFADAAFLETLRKAGQRTHDLEPAMMARLTSTVTSQGIIAVCRSAAGKPAYETARLLTLVDAVQDPGNLGAIFRTSLGFGMDGVLLGKGTVNPFNPKVVRGSTGTFLRVPFEVGVDLIERMDFLRRKGFTIVATDLHAKGGLDAIAPNRLRKVAILVGNEGAGTDPGLIKHADEVIRIPMQQGLESLNVSVAHGILANQLGQIVRQ